uniref:C-factor n=1 Tax=Phasianus colchicus TaxID=9054 RepID=A0A669R4S1_PHACC
MQSHQCHVQWDSHFHSPLGHTSSSAGQGAVGLLAHLGTLLPHVQPAVDQHIQAAAASVGERLKGSGLNLLINNAGIGNNNSLDNETLDDMLHVYTTNTIAPLLLGQAFLPLLKKAAQGNPGSGLSCSKAAIINMSSTAGSIQDLYLWQYGQALSYRCSKAALNMLTRCQSMGYRDHGILCVALHPGWVKTDMGGTLEDKSRVTVDESVGGMLKVLSNLSEKDSGTFLNWEGKVMAW